MHYATDDPGHMNDESTLIEGSGAQFSFKGEKYGAKKGTGLYLEPGEKAAVSAGGTKLVLMQLNVPKHTAKPTTGSANSYYFDKHGDVPFRPATTIETMWRAARFDLNDYSFAA